MPARSSPTSAAPSGARPTGANPTRRVLVASLVGTAIEFYDFYIYATAAVLVFGPLFFSSDDPTTAQLLSLSTFAIAFVARPFGSALFGHFGDRAGRKVTLVGSLLTMGVSTVLIGVLPTYAQAGLLAPVLLCVLRFGQGLGLGGEWGGAALLATENAPPGRRARFGSFPQLGAPIGFFFANGTFLLLTAVLTEEQFLSWGWRLPFLLSAVLVVVGLYVRFQLHETPAFRRVLEAGERERVPVAAVVRRSPRSLVLATLIMLATYVLFYFMTVFSLSHGTTPVEQGGLGFDRREFLLLLMAAVVFFGLFTPVAGLLADRFGRRRTLIAVTIAIALFGLLFTPLFSRPSTALVLLFLVLGLSLMGLTFGPMGAQLPELFPTAVRYTGASVSYNLASILGASFAPTIAAALVLRGGVGLVGLYLTAAALVTLVALLLVRETRDVDLQAVDGRAAPAPVRGTGPSGAGARP
ncbi:MFS transporter [Quadrisphaera sp. DSM 44207]|uniref:MFS transporter n=1 Tax=Quadrisphaera sp. DSM 44207 TaxID=1881057 RepID=UPI00088A0F2F|nr:MFS transporter [Quadrisphaera sp. DSM 44207]SDQ45799.1 metabolite-proton symporter [Quadrisphaera sp. DSM 44207]